ncbi:MAG: DUF1559 domain-containing protein, partial [Planctomycetaceae bacterium]|nr:DUF1559 domain-containing protein [Planctomycetaceae bacterium]
FHSGGVQVGLGDGSVRFISETINAKTTGSVDYCVLSGESLFGVWGGFRFRKRQRICGSLITNMIISGCFCNYL